MYKKIIRTSAAALIIGIAASCASHNTLTKQEVADGWVLLFDGETTNGWRNFNSDNTELAWHVVDGCLQANGVGRTSTHAGHSSSPRYLARSLYSGNRDIHLWP